MMVNENTVFTILTLFHAGFRFNSKIKLDVLSYGIQ